MLAKPTIEPASAPSCPSQKVPHSSRATEYQSPDRSRECRTLPCCCRRLYICIGSQRNQRERRSLAQTLPAPSPRADFQPTPRSRPIFPALASLYGCPLPPGMRCPASHASTCPWAAPIESVNREPRLLPSASGCLAQSDTEGRAP